MDLIHLSCNTCWIFFFLHKKKQNKTTEKYKLKKAAIEYNSTKYPESSNSTFSCSLWNECALWTFHWVILMSLYKAFRDRSIHIYEQLMEKFNTFEKTYLCHVVIGGQSHWPLKFAEFTYDQNGQKPKQVGERKSNNIDHVQPIRLIRPIHWGATPPLSAERVRPFTLCNFWWIIGGLTKNFVHSCSLTISVWFDNTGIRCASMWLIHSWDKCCSK